MIDELAEVTIAARNAIDENLRHNDVSLRELLWRMFPGTPDEVIDEVVEATL